MKFTIETVDTRNPAIVIEQYPCLADFEFNDGEITIYDIEDLMKLNEAVGYPLIVDKTPWYNKECPSIEIYDNWRE